MVMHCVSVGSSTFTTWKRRASAGSFSKYFLYSDQVVAAIVRNSPRARAGFSRLAASPWPAGSPGADHGVRFVDEEDDGRRRGLDFLDQTLQAIFEFAFDAGAGLQQREVQGPNSYVAQRRRHVALGDAKSETLDHCGLPYPGFAGENWIILPAAHQNVDDLANFEIASQHRIDFSRLALFR